MFRPKCRRSSQRHPRKRRKQRNPLPPRQNPCVGRPACAPIIAHVWRVITPTNQGHSDREAKVHDPKARTRAARRELRASPRPARHAKTDSQCDTCTHILMILDNCEIKADQILQGPLSSLFLLLMHRGNVLHLAAITERDRW